MRFTRLRERRPGGGPPAFTALFDSLPLKVGHLCQHGEHEFAGTTPDLPKPLNLDHNPFFEQPAHRGLHIKGVATKPIDREDTHDIPLPNISQQLREGRAIGCQHPSRHRFVDKLAIETATKGISLSLNRLIRRAGPKIGNSTHNAFPVSKDMTHL